MNVFEPKPYTGKTAFEQWAEYEGAPMIRDFIVPDLRTIALAPWDRLGASGTWLVLGAPEDQLSMAAYICEIPPGKALKPQRHLYEELIFILRGSGATTVSSEGGKSFTFEWKTGSLFSPPLNARHQHFNGSGSEPVRYVSLTNAPAVFNMFHSHEFIMNNPHRFTERFNDEEDYFSGKGETHPGDVWESNFIPDIVDLPFYEFSTKGPGMKHVEIELSSNTLSGHISESPVGVYKKAHRHGPGAYIIVLKGRGYSLMWKEGQKWERFDWGPMSMMSPPNRWFHQHFNLGQEPIRQLALKGWGQKYPIGGWNEMFKSTEAGGDMIEFEVEDPRVRAMYVEELKKEGIELRNPPVTYRKRA
ncbi:MAG TPA: cupin domain-containing protein [Candidatus Binatia bacterium]|jgi:quercetin dioxygenase-like cupin family protein